MATEKFQSTKKNNISKSKASKQDLLKLPRVPALKPAIRALKGKDHFKDIFGNTILELWCIRSDSIYSEILNVKEVDGMVRQLAGKTLICDLSGLEGTHFVSKIFLSTDDNPRIFVPAVGNDGPFVVRVMTFIPDVITNLDRLVRFSRSELGLEVEEMRKFVMRFPIISTLINRIPSLYVAMGSEVPDNIAMFQYFAPTQIGLAIKLILSQYLDSTDPLTYAEEQVAFDKVQTYLKEMANHANN